MEEKAFFPRVSVRSSRAFLSFHVIIVIQIIDSDDFISALQKLPGQGRSDKARNAGYQTFMIDILPDFSTASSSHLCTLQQIFFRNPAQKLFRLAGVSIASGDIARTPRAYLIGTMRPLACSKAFTTSRR